MEEGFCLGGLGCMTRCSPGEQTGIEGDKA